MRAALPRGGSFVILGESFSGPLALMAAAGRPAGLRGVVLCATFVRKPFRLAPAWVRFLAVAPVFGLWPLTIRLRYGWRGGAARPLVAAALRAIESVRPEVIAARARAVFTVDVERELVSCPVPVLSLAGRRDRLIRAHNAAQIARLRPDAETALVDATHFVLQLAPREASAAIARFLRRL